MELPEDFPKEFYQPNYENGSIINLMNTIYTKFGIRTEKQELQLLQQAELESCTNVVLLVLDGLGMNFLERYGSNTLFKKHLRGQITSVYPTATASAMTSFYTGLAPISHGVTGWFMHLKELGIVSSFLPFVSRNLENKLIDKPETAEKIFNLEPETKRIEKYKVIMPHKITNSHYSNEMIGKKNQVGISNLESFFGAIALTTKNKRNNKTNPQFLLGYWPGIDTYCHKDGVDNKKTIEHFEELEEIFRVFIETIEEDIDEGKTKIIVTADHGLIDSKEPEKIELKEFREIHSSLSLPLCGDVRNIYCYVKPSKTEMFEKYVKKDLEEYCYMMKSTELVNSGLLGKGNKHEKLDDRIGDYTLLMKKNFVLVDQLPEEEDLRKLIGFHGGLSAEELFVPLIVR